MLFSAQCRWFLVFVATWLTCPAAGFAQYPVLELTAVSPFVAKPGTTCEIQVRSGSNTDEIRELSFSQPEIRSELLMDSPRPFASEAQPRFGNFRVSIPPDIEPGRYEVRARGRHGISNPRFFWIQDFNSIGQEKPSKEADAPTHLQLGSAWHYEATPREPSYFRLDLERDQTVELACHAADLDSRMIPVLRLLDRAGRTLAMQHGSDSRDPVLRFQPPESGMYLLKVSDVMLRGGPDFACVLTAEIAQRRPPAWHASGTVDPSVQDLISQAQSIEEAELPLKIELPFVGSGVFDSPTDEDVFEFQATKGEMLRLEVLSERLNEPTDPRLILNHLMPKGDLTETRQVALADDTNAAGNAVVSMSTRDPDVALVIPETGTYQVRLQDLDNGIALSRTQRYLLRVGKPEPSFELLVYRPFPHRDINTSRPTGSKLMRGGTETIQVLCKRNGGWSGVVRMEAEGLPPGVTCAPATIAANQTQVQMTLLAAEDAASGVARIRFRGTAEMHGLSQSVVAKAFSIQSGRGQGRDIIRSRPTDTLWLAVSDQDQAPISVGFERAEFEVKQGQELKLPVKLMRQDAAKQNCVLRPQSLPSKVSCGELTIAGDKLEGDLQIKVAADAPVGTYSIWFQTETKIKWKDNPQALERAESYRALLEKLKQDTEQDQDVVASAIVDADKRVEAAKSLAAEKDRTVFVPSPHVTLRVLSSK